MSLNSRVAIDPHKSLNNFTHFPEPSNFTFTPANKQLFEPVIYNWNKVCIFAVLATYFGDDMGVAMYF
tara:strand:+ start:299 stop:502 length:204 start_codon:yes stop_codon:yes gene_type:complete